MNQYDLRCERCQIRSLDCDGNMPCDHCTRYSKRTKQHIDCRFIQSQLLNNSQASYASMSPPISSISPSLTFGVTPNTEFYQWRPLNSQSNGLNHLISPTQSLESHLLNLDFLTVHNYMFDLDASLILSTYHPSISNELKMMILKENVVFSNHPNLFLNTNNQLNKVDIANNLFPSLIFEDLLKQSNDIQTICDNIRALTRQGGYKIGHQILYDSSIYNAYALAYSKIDYKIHFQDMQQNVNKPMSVDELMGLLKPMQELGINDKSKISQIEQLQVYMVWVFLYEFNTCGSLTTSDSFHIDDNALDNLISFDTHVPLKSYYRHFLPDLAKYTIWEGTCWAFTFDEMREMSYAFPKMIVNPKLFIQDTLSDMKLLRTVVRLTRLTQYNMDISENVNSIVDLHERILASLSKINADYSYFDSLKYFVYGSTENPPIPKIKFLPMSITESVVRLLMLSFLHLRVLNSNASYLILFPLSADGIRFYTSQDILYTTTNAVCYLIQQLSIPLQPHDTLFEPFQYPHDEYIRCCSQPVDSSCPSPALVSYILCFLINGIVSASLKAYVDKNSDPLLRQSLYKMVETTVLPTLDKIANIWKGARVFPDRIRASLSVF